MVRWFFWVAVIEMVIKWSHILNTCKCYVINACIHLMYVFALHEDRIVSRYAFSYCLFYVKSRMIP